MQNCIALWPLSCFVIIVPKCTIATVQKFELVVCIIIIIIIIFPPPPFFLFKLDSNTSDCSIIDGYTFVTWLYEEAYLQFY